MQHPGAEGSKTGIEIARTLQFRVEILSEVLQGRPVVQVVPKPPARAPAIDVEQPQPQHLAVRELPDELTHNGQRQQLRELRLAHAGVESERGR